METLDAASWEKEETKEYRQLVSAWGQARKQMDSLNQSWKTYRESWMAYVEKLISQWDSHVTQYEQGEKDFIKQKADAAAKMEDLRVRIKEAHTRAIELKAEHLEHPAFEEETQDSEMTEHTAQHKRLRESMETMMTQMKSCLEETSPRRRKKDDSQDVIDLEKDKEKANLP